MVSKKVKTGLIQLVTGGHDNSTNLILRFKLAFELSDLFRLLNSSSWSVRHLIESLWASLLFEMCENVVVWDV